jgi:hypothetical protein
VIGVLIGLVLAATLLIRALSMGERTNQIEAATAARKGA